MAKKKKRRKSKKSDFSYSTWNLKGKKSKRFDSFKVYIIKCWDEEETFYKIGKTYTTVEQRFPDLEVLPYQYEVVKIEEGNAFHISNLEKKYHRELKQYKYTPVKKFAGCQECFHKIIEDNEKPK